MAKFSRKAPLPWRIKPLRTHARPARSMAREPVSWNPTVSRTRSRHRPKVLVWDAWDGRPWNPMDYSAVYDSPYHHVVRYDTRLLAAQQLHLNNSAHPYGLDYFLRDTSAARLEAHESTRPFFNVMDNLSILQGVLLWTPLPLYRRLCNSWLALAQDSWELSSELTGLHKTRLLRVYHNRNPLAFMEQMKRARISRSSGGVAETTREIRQHRKLIRLEGKMMARLNGKDLKGNMTQFRRSLQRRQTLEDFAKLNKHSDGNLKQYQWVDQHPRLWAVSGFPIALHLLFSDVRKTLKVLTRRCQMTKVHPRIVRVMTESMMKIKADSKHIWGLVLDVSDIRYYRLYNYPEMDRASEIEAGRAIAQYAARIVEEMYAWRKSGWSMMDKRERKAERANGPGFTRGKWSRVNETP